MGRIRVYVADQQLLFRKGICFTLSTVENLEVVGDTSSNEEALKFVESNLPLDVAILNINDSKPSGIQITRTIKQNFPSVSVILLMDHQDDEHLFSAMKSGASACISKDIDPGYLVSVVSDVARGAKPISKALLRAAVARRIIGVEDVLAKLSVDEADILSRVAKGTSGELAAEALGMSEGSLNVKLASILSKLIANEGLVPQEQLLTKPSDSPQGWAAQLEDGMTGTLIKEEPILATAEEMAEALQATVIQPDVTEEVVAETSVVPITLQKEETMSAPEEPESVRPEPVLAPVTEAVLTGVRKDARTTKLINSLSSGKLAEINPEINLALEDGFTYPEADKILGTSGKATLQILESLTDEDILVKHFFVRLLLTPEGSLHMIPQEFCSQCDGNDVVKGQFIEHSDCGYVGLESEFTVRGEYVCPKCRKKLRLIGTDYRQLGIRYRCNNCHEIITTPVMKLRSLGTSKFYALEELHEFRLNSYRLNPSTDFQLNSKARLIDFLRSSGYKVEEMAKVKGKSGVVHSLDILASRDDLIVQHHLGIGVFAAKEGEAEVSIDDLLNFQAKAVDMGIHNLIIVAISRLSPQAQSLAETQQIKVLTVKDIMNLSPEQPRFTPVTETAGTGQAQPEVTEKAVATAAQEAAGPADLRKVLWIDKDSASSAEFARVLRIAGFEVTAFVDPEDGLQKLNESSLVVLDDELSRAGQVCSQIRNQSSVPIILIGSEKGEEVRDGAESTKADAYLRRSISGRELVARIRSILRRR